MIRKYLFMLVFVLMASFIATNGVAAAEADYLNIDFSTDKSTYELDEEATSTITITNSSKIYDAEGVEIKTNLPEDFDVVDDDKIKVENREIIWDVDNIKHGESLELTLKTKLKQSASDEIAAGKEESTKNDEEEGNNKGDKSEQNNETVSKVDDNTPTQEKEDMIAPQTGDDSNILKFVLILLASVMVGIASFIVIRKKRMSKLLPFVLAFVLLAPAWTVSAETGQNEQQLQKITEKHEVTIGDKSYHLETTVTGEMHDNRGQIPVTGTAYDSNGNLLINEELTFSSTMSEETVVKMVETDDEGYFVIRLSENTSFKASGSNLKATVKPVKQNDIDVTNETGEIKLGKTLSNGDNFSALQPSVIYLSDEQADSVNSVSEDLSKVTLSNQIDIQTKDLIVIPKWEGYPSGIALQVESVSDNNGKMTLKVKQPELEEIFEEIVGDVKVDLTPENFIPASGVTMQGGSSVLKAKTFSGQIMPAASLGSSVVMDLGGIFEEDTDGFTLDGSLSLNGTFSGDIEWRFGFNPVQELDFQFKGEQVIDAELSSTLIDKSAEIEIGEMIIPTEIPGLTVGVPVDLLVSAKGEVSVKISTGMKENFGIAYEKGVGVSTYPDKHFDPFFHVTSIDGKGTATTDLRLSVLAQALGLDLAGAAITGGVTGDAEARINGEESEFNCAHLDASFHSKLNLRAPLFDWESDGITYSETFASTVLGNCLTSIKGSPSEIELSPGETKSINMVGSDGQIESNIYDYDHFTFKVSDEDSIGVAENAPKIDITASDSAQDGDVIEVEANYDLHGETLTDTIKVTIVDDRDTGELVGQVIDAVEGTKIAKADIKIFNDNGKVTDIQTDSEGKYKINLVPGSYKLEVSQTGYITDTTRIQIKSADTTTYDSKLQLVGDEYAGEGTASGKIKDAVSGLGVPNIEIAVRKGKNNTTGEIVETLMSDENGRYSVELPGGNYTIALSAEGYISTNANILSIGGKQTDNQDATISLDGAVDSNLRIVLTWGEEPRDLDSHLTGPRADEGRFHIYYSNKVYQDAQNDVNLDRDDTNSYGPETVTVLNQIQDGTYTYSIHNYTGRFLDEDNQFDLSNSKAKVQVYKDDTLLETYNVPIDQKGNSWRVLEVRDGDIVPINKVETIDDWDAADSFAPVNN